MNSCAAVGNFDGVHRGHRRIVRTACETAFREGLVTEVLTFEQNTKNRFGGTVPLLCSNGEKEALLRDAGADRVSFLTFDRAFASMSGEEFLEFLIREKSVRHIVCGDNFRFSRGAACGVAELTVLCREKQIGCTVVPTDGISSTRIREWIAAGRMEDAAALLGRDFSYSAPFTDGNRIGRTIGFPTLNQKPKPGYLLPPDGVYVTYAAAEGKRLPAVTNIGTRPTVTDSPERVLETHFLGLSSIPDDLLPSLERIFFLARLRGETRFGSLGELKAAIARDGDRAARYFGPGQRSGFGILT